jgi:hypothetical protein
MRITDATTSKAEEWPRREQCDFWEHIDRGNWFNTCNDVYWKDPISVIFSGRNDEL